MRFVTNGLGIAACIAGASCASRGTSSQIGALAVVRHTTFDHVGFGAGPAVFTDEGGHLLEERRSEPYGAPIGIPDLVPRDLGPLNKRVDVATGWSDHGARWLTPETGHWLAPDPVVIGPDAALMTGPWALHPYQYVDQNPVAYWDPDGRDKRPSREVLRAGDGNQYTLTVRRYAAPPTFGGGFEGDNRGPSTSVAATARTRLDVFVDLTRQSAEAVGSASPSQALGRFARWNPGAWGKPTVAVATVDTEAHVIAGSPGVLAVHGESAGANPIMRGAPNIDTQIDVIIEKRAGELVITGTVTGNKFPWGEYFITDSKGNSAMLGSFEAHGSPYTSLWGEDRDKVLSSFTSRIGVDENGDFKGWSITNGEER
jgi:RHS repeat-associated protein